MLTLSKKVKLKLQKIIEQFSCGHNNLLRRIRGQVAMEIIIEEGGGGGEVNL